LESSSVENTGSFNSHKEKEKVSTTSNGSGKKRRIFFETKSLAEVYAKQGHISMALEIYKRIQKKKTSDQQIEERISELEARLSSKRGIKAEETLS